MTCEVCPSSNVALGRLRPAGGRAAAHAASTAGVPVALAPTTRCCSAPGWPRSTRWPASVHGFTDAELAELARLSVRGSWRPDDVRARLLAGIDDWLACGPVAPQSGRRRPAPAR